ncbi:MAG TPA: L-threonylcarbamoyladenylate synthase [Mariprofundaceae bacterium]|nr:L-threonylcarbamoyladenylate synthase [Mariprofundaceae bacterium]
MRVFERLRLDPERPQSRLVRRAADLLRQGVFAAVPTDTTYTLMCAPEAFKAQGDIRRLRALDDRHLWSLVCSDLSQASRYVKMDNAAYRIVRHHLPGPYTFILPAASALPRRIFGRRRDVGIRIPEHPVCRMLLDEFGEPLVATTLQFAGDDTAETDPERIVGRLRGNDCVVLDVGWGGMVPTTVVDLCGTAPDLIRHGAGEWPV